MSDWPEQLWAEAGIWKTQWESQNPPVVKLLSGAASRIIRLEKALREMQVDAADILDSENRPGYELREYAEQIHAMAALALSSGERVKNECEATQSK